MGQITRQIRLELKQLPLMLGKLLGGLAAVVGCTMAVLIATRSPNASFVDSLPPLLIAGAGIVVFILSGRAMARRPSAPPAESNPVDRMRMNTLAWTLLVTFAGIFLTVVWFLTVE